MKRTAAIYILTILAFVAGFAAIIDVFRYLGWALSELSFLGSPILGGILSALVAAIWFWAGFRIWNLDPQGWLFLVSIAAIYLIFDVISWIAGTPIELLLPSILLSGLALILGILPSTREEFGTG